MRRAKRISVDDLFREARSLKSEDGDNPEYDRALVELTGFLAGYTVEYLGQVAARLGIPWRSYG